MRLHDCLCSQSSTNTAAPLRLAALEDRLQTLARGALALSLIVDYGWSVARAAERFQMSWPSTQRWADRVPPARQGRDERPVLTAAAATEHDPAALVRKILHVRLKRRLGPLEIAGIVRLPASTVHAVLSRCGSAP